MANVYGSNYQKEWLNDPSEQADKGSQNARTINHYDELAGIAAADKLILCKIQHQARFIGLSALGGGALGAGALESIDKDGNASALASGDLIDGAIEGGLEIVLTADGATSAALKALVSFLMD